VARGPRSPRKKRLAASTTVLFCYLSRRGQRRLEALTAYLSCAAARTCEELSAHAGCEPEEGALPEVCS
jgi:hypothetical protein